MPRSKDFRFFSLLSVSFLKLICAYPLKIIFRHSTYKNQYRAMFVSNCRVNIEEILRFPEVDQKSKKKRKGKKRKLTEATGTADTETPSTSRDEKTDDIFHPVHCLQCNTEVGVFDKEEVYHFFNVLASY